MRRRRYLAVSLGLMGPIVGSTGSIAAVGQETDTDSESEPEPIRFTGSGTSVTEEFELEGGVTITEAVHDGESNFIVELIPTDDGFEELLVNAIGDFNGASGVLAEEGTYLLDIDADGSWEIEIQQPRAAVDDADALPVELEGDRPGWDGPFRFDGLGQARGTHEGEENFIVEILPQDGLFSEPVFNEIGQFDGETTFDIEGVGYVTIDADGPWSLSLE
ncbi:hypothetical protein [Natrinema amylolyticum]|uniref:hypothetical protein n=1 Tax=Natrinema amylolyticum TaxID=2878679 RepID=UPI001CF970AD|nr:hypothetical protein [Natrinema amylolyticum]